MKRLLDFLQRHLSSAAMLAVLVGSLGWSLDTYADDKRFALLIGNQKYTPAVGPLNNTINDITLLKPALDRLSFRVTLLSDADQRKIKNAVSDFAHQLSIVGADAIGFFYYAGHGVSRPGNADNYLIPIDVVSFDDRRIWNDAVSLDWVLDELQTVAPDAAHFVVFDACRNELKLPLRGARGFTPMAERPGVFIAFSTSPNDFASDGTAGTNGPYAAALAHEIVRRGVDHRNMFHSVKVAVHRSTEKRQLAWERNGLLKTIFFAGSPIPGQQPIELPPVALAARVWQDIKDTTSRGALQNFMEEFPNTTYAHLANERLEELKSLSDQNRGASYDVVPVWFGTNRAISSRKNGIRFGPSRSKRLTYGRVEVTIPRSHTFGKLERGGIVVRATQSQDPEKHITIRQKDIMGLNEWEQDIRQRSAGTQIFKNKSFVFVHGFNMSFNKAIMRTAQVAYDLGFDGPVYLFSWPSAGGILHYLEDIQPARASSPQFRQFLIEIARQSQAESIHLIAEGSGVLPLIEVLKELTVETADVDLNIGQVVLVAPDMDRDAFEASLSDLTAVTQGVTLYVNGNDRFLKVSEMVLGSPRAGGVSETGPVVLPGIDTIDFTSTRKGYLIDSSYFAEDSSVLKDIAQLLRTGIRPPDRRSAALTRVRLGSRGIYWKYPWSD